MPRWRTDRVDLPGDLSDAEVGIGKLAAEPGIVAPLPDEVLVVRQRVIEQLLRRLADVDGILLLEQCVFADAGQVIFHGRLGHVEVGLGLLADGFLARACAWSMTTTPMVAARETPTKAAAAA